MTKARVFKIFKWSFIAGVFLAICVALFAFVFILTSTRDLPPLETLSNYKPPIMTRVHAGDGKLIEEFAEQQRVFIAGDKIPDQLKHAFIAAEDKRFYTHNGWDPIGLSRAVLQAPIRKLKKQRIGGTSTITQQVAKNFIVGDDYSIRRKIREIAIARRMEKVLDKEQIIELYLNEIYFGRRSYGVAAASLNYFGEPLNNLSLAEMTYLAALPKGPNNYRLDEQRGRERAAIRQSYILGRMTEDEYITQAQSDTAKAETLEWITRFDGQEYLAADYFVEEARKEIFDLYGEEELYSGGLSIRTTLDTDMQLSGRRALRAGLERFDRRRGYRGAIGHFDDFSDWKKRLAAFESPPDIAPWRVALVRSVSYSSAKLSFATDIDETVETANNSEGLLTLSGVEWAAKVLPEDRKTMPPEAVSDVVKAGDIILVEAVSGKSAQSKGGIQTYNLRQIPIVNGGLIAMDPHTGRVLALVGGYSFNQSQYNRVTQAKRQPGSAFKPFVYAAALENDFTPSSQVLDAPFVIERHDADKCDDEEDLLADGEALDGSNQIEGLRRTAVETPENASQEDEESTVDEGEEEEEECERFYKPSNYTDGRWYGLSTLRLGLEKSRNAMTVRLASDIGMAPVMRIGRRSGVYDNVQPELAWSLGAGETTLMRLAQGYSVLVNGGKDVTPRIIDRVQNGQGETIYLQGEEACEVCAQEEWTGQSAPDLADSRDQAMDPITAYQVTYMLKGVVDNGTGRSIKVLGRPLGGKTGTTNDYKDAWFMGFSPDLVTGVYVGYDTPRSLANEAGGTVAAPIFRDFMGDVLKNEPKVPFRIPEGITLAPVNRDTGEPSFIGAPNYILEAYRSGTEPRLGQFGTTISVGGGYDLNESYEDSDSDVDFYSLDYGFEDEVSEGAGGEDAAENEASTTDKEVEETDAAEADANESSDGDAVRPEDEVAEESEEIVGSDSGDKAPAIDATDKAPSELDSVLDDAKKAIDKKKTQKVPPKPPVAEDEENEDEENLDDGIY
ncbi:MAG: transglycosylase domain-containing protein [Maricaulaceae bacterium]